MIEPGDENRVGLPRAKDESRMLNAWDVFVLGGVERLTESLRRGHKFNLKSLKEMQALQYRFNAFSDALDSRLPLTEDEE